MKTSRDAVLIVVALVVCFSANIVINAMLHLKTAEVIAYQPAPVVYVVEDKEEAPAKTEAEPVVEEPAEEKASMLDNAQCLGEAKITHYCVCEKCCGKTPDHPAYGITASGRTAVPGASVAVDPSLIPLGSEVLIDYGDGVIHTYSADDTGGGVKGNHIDVCSTDHQTALTLGVKTAEVWFIAPEK